MLAGMYWSVPKHLTVMATPYETCEKIRNTTGRMSGSCSLPVAATAAIGGGASTSPPPVRTFEETAYDEPHQGLIRLNQAASLLEKGDSSNKDEVRSTALRVPNEKPCSCCVPACLTVACIADGDLMRIMECLRLACDLQQHEH